MDDHHGLNREGVTKLIQTLKREQKELETHMKVLMETPNPTAADTARYKELKQRHAKVKHQKHEVQKALKTLAEQGPEDIRRASFVNELKDPQAWRNPSSEASGASREEAAGCSADPHNQQQIPEEPQAKIRTPRQAHEQPPDHGVPTDAEAERFRREAAAQKAKEEEDWHMLHPGMHGTTSNAARAAEPVEMERASVAMQHLEEEEKNFTHSHPVLYAVGKVYMGLEWTVSKTTYYLCECPCLTKVEKDEAKAWGVRETRMKTRRSKAQKPPPAVAV